MKHNKYIITILIIFNIIIVFILYKNKEKSNAIIKQYWDCHFQLNNNIDNRNKSITLSIFQYHAENRNVNNIELYDCNNKNIFLSDILSNRPKLIYYYSKKGCLGCYEPFLYKLDSLSNSIGSDNIIVISDFSNHRSFMVSINNKFKHLNIYRTKEKLEIISSKENDYAYAFLVESDMKAHKVIITDKSNTDFTSEYLNYMIEYFKHMD